MSEHNETEVKEEIDYKVISDFLESTPPNQVINISNLAIREATGRGGFTVEMHTPEIQLHCEHEHCNGTRFFRCISGKNQYLNDRGYEFFYLTYRCSNCQSTEKTFSIAAKTESIQGIGEQKGLCYKFGELPTYGPPTSPKLMKFCKLRKTQISSSIPA